MKFIDRRLELVDQRLLPKEERWLKYDDVESVAKAIEDMVVRGAPAIGCSAAYGLRLGAQNTSAKDWRSYQEEFAAACERLAMTRPTAVNLFYAIDRFKALSEGFEDGLPIAHVQSEFAKLSDDIFNEDLDTCRRIGMHGAQMTQEKVRVLTHCNAGALATAGYGTAIGVIRALHEQGKLECVYIDETRPYLQGSRLTAFEMTEAGIPHQLICDSAAAYLMQQGKVDWAVVGADRIAANGDAANKIGTYSVAVNARYHGVKFFVAAPRTTFDLRISTGAEIPVEQRAADEITHFRGDQIAPGDVEVYNPSFDVTPHELIDGIITEDGVLMGDYETLLRPQ